MALDDATLPNVIADCSATLRQLFRDQINDVSAEGRVVFGSPAEVEAGAEMRLGVFLYQVQESAAMRNQLPLPESVTGGRRVQPLELSYLVTAYAQQIEDAHRLLGRVMRVMFEFGTLQGSILQGALADIGQPLRIVMHPFGLEEINRLWAVFPSRAYRASLVYQVSPVLLLSSLQTGSGRVVMRELDYGVLRVGA